jgi:hypothetical protein
MNFKIVTKLRPFSHTAGARCIIPGTSSEIQAFPTLLKIDQNEVQLDLTGPVEGFTLQQDLEKNCVFVFGRAQEGYYKLRIEASPSGFWVRSERGKLLKEDKHLPQEIPFVLKSYFERLSLGSHKAQDWDLVQKRGDLKEILPTLFYLGQKIPQIAEQPLLGTARLLQMPSSRNLLEKALQNFVKAAFSSLLVPRLIDDQHQGLVKEEPVFGNRFFLLQEATSLIRGLFFRQNERRLALLPSLPISFDCGKFVGLQAPGIGEINLDWSKKELRLVKIKASTSGEIILDLQKEIKSFRINKAQTQKRDEPLILEAGRTYLLDRFQS